MVTACMAFGAMSLKDGSKVIAISCIGLTWLEAVLGFCLGCWMWNTYVAKLLGKEVCHECVMDFEDITPAVVPLGSLDATEGTKMVKDSIAAHPICVFSKSSCPHCIRAKNRLASLNIDYHVVELDSLPNPKAVAFALTDMTGRNTVPNIFIGGKSIGGASELIALADEGNLLPMVAQLGVQIDSPKAAQHDIEMGDVKTNL